VLLTPELVCARLRAYLSRVLQNGSVCEQSILGPGDSYVYPRNLVHSARNPSCTTPTTYIAFFTAFDQGTINIASSAYAIPGSPFKSYANPQYNSSLSKSRNTARAPLCMYDHKA
jgi:hypothetical protein